MQCVFEIKVYHLHMNIFKIVVGQGFEYYSVAGIGKQFLMSVSVQVSVQSVSGLMSHMVKIYHVLIMI